MTEAASNRPNPALTVRHSRSVRNSRARSSPARHHSDSAAATPKPAPSSRASRVATAPQPSLAISASLATVFMLRAVPALAAGIASLDRAMPSP